MMDAMELTPADLEDLHDAKDLLENPSLAAKITNLFGTPLEKGFELLPERWTEAIQGVTKKSLERALGVAIRTLDKERRGRSRDGLHKLLVAATGGVGGAFGLAALAVELPVSTTVMLRSIADVARSEGERLDSPETQLACLEVFALGGRARGDDASETGYFVVRASLARLVAEAAHQLAEHGVAGATSSAVGRLIARVAARFGTAVSEKVAAQSVPVVGAAGGAIVNTLFIDHFQDVARGHFIVRRLERTYGQDAVKAAYGRL